MARPLIKVCCVMKPGSDYPIAVKIPMDDGKVVEYEMKQNISPVFAQIKAQFDESLNISIGYQMGRKKKNRIRRGKR